MSTITGLSYSLVSYLAPTKASAADAKCEEDDICGTRQMHNVEMYEWVSKVKGKRVLCIKAVGLREIMRDSIDELKDASVADAEKKLPAMIWDMLVRTIAQDLYGKTTKGSKNERDLVTMLRIENGCNMPAQVLEKERPLVKGEGFASFMEKGHYDQLAVLEVYIGSNGKLGRFPDKLCIRVPEKFIDAVKALPAPEAEKPNPAAPVAADMPSPQAPEPASNNVQAAKAPEESKPEPGSEAPAECEWYKVQVAGFKPKSMADSLAINLNLMLKETNSGLKAYVQNNGDGMWGVGVVDFGKDDVPTSSKEDAEKSLKDLKERLSGKSDLSKLKPFVKLDNLCGWTGEEPEEPAAAQASTAPIYNKVEFARFDSDKVIENMRNAYRFSGQLKAKGFETCALPLEGGAWRVQVGAFTKQYYAKGMLKALKSKLCWDAKPDDELCGQARKAIIIKEEDVK